MHSRIKPEYGTVTAKHEITVTINRTTVSVNVRQESIDAELQECSPRKQSRATPLEHIYWGMAGYETLTAIYSAYAVQEAADEPVSSATGEAIAAYAKQFIGVPYVWGGEDLNVAVDCSGFVRAVMIA